MTPLSAEELLNITEDTVKSGAPEARSTAQLPSSPAAPITGMPAEAAGVAAAANTASASAEAAAEAAAKANAVAAATLRNNEEESDSSTNGSTDTDAELLNGVRASRAFKVVPSQIKDLLDDNTHALRVTPKKGIESKISQFNRLISCHYGFFTYVHDTPA